MTRRLPTLLTAVAVLAAVGGAIAWAYGAHWRWPWRAADGVAQPLWLLQRYRGDLQMLDRGEDGARGGGGGGGGRRDDGGSFGQSGPMDRGGGGGGGYDRDMDDDIPF